MTITKETIKGVPLPAQPSSISRCGMSRAKFARRQVSGEWYELSSQGRRIGVPTEFDFYMEGESKSPVGITEAKKKELVEV